MEIKFKPLNSRMDGSNASQHRAASPQHCPQLEKSPSIHRPHIFRNTTKQGSHLAIGQKDPQFITSLIDLDHK